MQVVQHETKEFRTKAFVPVVRYLVVTGLLVALCFEGYYIFKLRATIKKQTEDLRSISVQIQLLKSERELLHEEISSAKKLAGENNNGNATQR